MSAEVLQFSITVVFTACFFFLVWLITKLHKPETVEIRFDTPWKEGALAIGYVTVLFLIVAMVFFFLVQRTGVPLGTYEQYDLITALSWWGIYAAVYIIPVLVICKARKQNLQTLGVGKKNMKLSLEMGLLISLLIVFLSTTPELLQEKFFTYNTFYAFIYFLAVGFGEELLFRGFLQIRCSTWLGEIRGWILASTIMGIIHIPSRIFVLGLEPIQALVSVVFIIPFSLLMGFIVLKTRSILGPTVIHTVTDWMSVLR